MFGQTWYNQSFKKYIYTFGALFNDISIQRLDSSGNPITGQLIKVPIAFSQKDKWLRLINQNPDAGEVAVDGQTTQKPVEIVLPRMGYQMGTPTYDPIRKLQSINKNVHLNGVQLGDLNYVFNPVPYIFPFTLTIATKTLEDLFQIVEQVTPFFTPTFTVTLIENQLPQSKDITLVIKSLDIQDSPYGDPKAFRIITADITFDLLGYLYQPQHNAKVIREVDLRWFATNHPISDGLDSEDLDYVASGTAPVGGFTQVTVPTDPNAPLTTDPLPTTTTTEDIDPTTL